MRKVLIANRGEIAVRVARTLREMGIATVAVYSDADHGALHVRSCDEAYPIGPAPAAASYLDVERILDVAVRAGADAVHPGYGFLSENPELAERCEARGVVFIGPPASAMRAMGSKPAARATMAKAGVPIVPGGPAGSLAEAEATAERIGYPVLLKAAAGGGGKGMRLVSSRAELASAWESARSVAQKFFADPTVYLEKGITRPRHVEIQVLADRAGNAVHLFERDCSIQRRHQKIVEETPCPAATPLLIERMGEVAVRATREVGYFSAGTFEFLLADDGAFYFLEMNTRLQVEHPITEWITGIDLVREMVRVARGEPLAWTQAQIARRGAALECRIYAEDPETGFLPSAGRITSLRTPSGPFVRDDSGVEEGALVSSYYDPLLSKLSVWAPDRDRALRRMRRALGEYAITGVRTNLQFHENLLAHAEFIAGDYDTEFVDRNRSALLAAAEPTSADDTPLAVAVALAAAKSDAAQGARAEDTDTLSPWVAAHRAGLRNRDGL